jgi:hypothetical protein
MLEDRFCEIPAWHVTYHKVCVQALYSLKKAVMIFCLYIKSWSMHSNLACILLKNIIMFTVPFQLLTLSIPAHRNFNLGVWWVSKQINSNFSLRGMDLPWTAGAVVAGMAVFPATLFFGQRAIIYPLCVGAHQRILGSVLGGAVVFAASIAASEACRAVYSLRNARIFSNGTAKNGMTISRCLLESLAAPMRLERWALYGMAGTTMFSGLGGALRAVAPSNIRYPGAFASKSLSAAGSSYASESQRAALNAMGQRLGCHTCGVRRASFVGDHQPPNKLARPWEEQRFYPQCTACSSRQGAALAGDRQLLCAHTALRAHHIWLPAGVALSHDLGLE